MQSRDRLSEPGPGIKPSPRSALPAAPPLAALRLQRAAGNRAFGRVLARRIDIKKLAESASVVQPPVSWTKYPPDVERMSKVELFEAIQLIDDWRKKHLGSRHGKELEALRETIRLRAKRVTTSRQWSTYRKWVKAEPAELEDLYTEAARHLIDDRADFQHAYDLDAIDEVVQERFPGAPWHAKAKQWMRDTMREQERRAERYAKMPWYQKGTYDTFQEKARSWPKEARDLARELAWVWIEMRDAGHSRDKIEDKIQSELASLYEQVLRQIDEQIQKECKRNKPETWDERIRANLGKAYGDPCKPWFDGFGSGHGRGFQELLQFQRILKIVRHDDPLTTVSWWVEEYAKAYMSLTDPKTQMDQLRKQASISLVGGMAGALANYARFMKGVAVPFLGRKGATFLRGTVVGFRLSVGEPLGGAGPPPGGVGTNRPNVVQTTGPPKPVATPKPGTPVAPPKTPAKPPATPAKKPEPKPSLVDRRPRDHPALSAREMANVKRYGSRSEVRAGAASDLRGLDHGVAVQNPEKVVLDGLIGRMPKTLNNDRLRALYPRYYKTLRDPQAYADFMAEIWERAAKRQISTVQALEEFTSGGAKPTQVSGELTQQHLRRDPPFIDFEFSGDQHGTHTHMFQEGLISYKHGAGAGREFRKLIANSTGPDLPRANGTTKKFYESVWDAMFDEYDGNHINRPEKLGPVLEKNLGFPRNMPKP